MKIKAKIIKFFFTLLLLNILTSIWNLCIAQEDKVSSGNLLILGVTSSYFNYEPKELNYFITDTKKDYFLIGFSIGFIANGLMLDISYLSKFYPNEIYQIANGYKLIHNFDSYTLEIGYTWNFFKELLFLGPFVFFSLDTSWLKLFKDVNINSQPSNWIVKDIYSKTSSLGIGLKIFLTRYIKFSFGYKYGFANTMNYEGAPMEGLEMFQPSGLIASLTLGL